MWLSIVIAIGLSLTLDARYASNVLSAPPEKAIAILADVIEELAAQ